MTDAKPLTIACVMKIGDRYDEKWANRLRQNAAAFAPAHSFMCLTDLLPHDGSPFDPDINLTALLHGWPGWWSKMELFRPGIFRRGSRILYVDLDDIVVANLAPLLEPGPFTIAQDPYRRGPGRFSSAVMSWDADDPAMATIYDAFAADPARYVGTFRGDQEFIMDRRPHARTWPVELVASFKGDCRPRAGIPPGAVVVSCHGDPKPPRITDPWFRERWLASGGW